MIGVMKSFLFSNSEDRKRRFVCLFLFFCFFSLIATIPFSYAQTLDEVVASVEKHYQHVPDLTAKVTQKNILKALGKTQIYEGTLQIKKPGKLKLEYKNGQVIVVNGADALIYTPKSRQVVKKTFSDFQQMNIPVAFLLGAAHIRDDFKPRQPDSKKPRAFELVPKKQGAVMKKLNLEVTETGRIVKLTILDKSGNATELTFNDVNEGVGLNDAVFEFTPPKGTNIIEQ